MKAEIKRLHSPDIDDLLNYQPLSDNFSFLLQMMVGPKGGDGEESFDLTVCTPSSLTSDNKKSEVLLGLYHLIVFEYSYHSILDTLSKIVSDFEGENWDELAEQIGKIGKWEFDNYKF